MAAGSKPPSVRASIRLSGHVQRLRAASDYLSTRPCTGEVSPFHRFVAGSVGRVSGPRNAWGVCGPRVEHNCGPQLRAPESPGRDCPRWVSSPSLWPRAAPSGGARPASLGIRTPHRSGDDVSLLFQSRRSPAPGLRPVTCPTGGGTFLMACATGAGLPLPPTGTPVARIRLTNHLF